MNIDWKRFSFFAVSIFCGAIGFLFGQPLIHGNDLAVNVIVTVFSILAGFLVAIMSIMGEQGSISMRSWRASEINHKNIYGRLVRQKWMFYLYLVTLGLIFISSLINKGYPTVGEWVERLYLGMAITAFILSMGLPTALMKIQMDRHEEIIAAKKKNVGITS